MNFQITKTNINKNIALLLALVTILSGFSAIVLSNQQPIARADVYQSAPAAASSTPAVAPAEVAAPQPTSTTPSLTSVKNTDSVITGASVANSVITLKDGNGSTIGCKEAPVTTNYQGVFLCSLLQPVAVNTIVMATSIEAGKNMSSPANVSVSQGTVAPVAAPSPVTPTPAPASNPGLLTFNIPEGLRNSTTPTQYTANLDPAALGDWTVKQGLPLAAVGGMVPYLAQKDDNNYLSTLLSNQTPDITKKPTTRIVLDQAALDAASGITNFKPVEIGGISNLVRIPNLSTPATDDWWFVPKSSIEPNGYTATENDVKNVGTQEATIGFYKTNPYQQTTPMANVPLPYSFILEGTPAAFAPSNAFSLKAKATSAENLNYIDNIVKTSTFENAGLRLGLPNINLPKLPGITTPALPAVGGWNWNLWWLLPLLLFLALIAFIWWLLKKLFGWGNDDTSKYSRTYTGFKNNYKKTVTTPTPKYEAPKYEAPKYVAPKIEEEVTYVPPSEPKIAKKTVTYSNDYKKAAVPVAAVAAATMEYTKKEAPKQKRNSFRMDDFKIIEGIGPVIERNLHDADILTYEELSNTTEAQIEKILAPITNNFTVFNCSTWAEQAKLAADGKFDELEKLKAKLDKGVRR